MPLSDRYTDRELSWLSFNERVLQEAENPDNPVVERLRFLAIFSSNLDEFFRVRVANLRRLENVGRKKVKRLGFTPGELLDEIARIVHGQQERFGRAFRDEILPDLATRGLRLLSGTELSVDDARLALPDLDASDLDLTGDGRNTPFLSDGELYFICVPAADTWSTSPGPDDIGILRIPDEKYGRFIPLSDPGRYAYLDDIVRRRVGEFVPGARAEAVWSIKLSRDADLLLEDEFAGDVAEMIRKRLPTRETGTPIRCLYDASMPAGVLDAVRERLGLDRRDLFEGGRYHNFSDLWSLPVEHLEDATYPPMPPLDHPELADTPSVLDAVRNRDRLVVYPYQKMDPLFRLLDEAVGSEATEAMWITIYRVANDSSIIDRLIAAAERGISVTAFIEVKARFDEASNLEAADRLRAAGARIVTSRPGIKVHSKMLLIQSRDGDVAYLSTGNFNEKTARIYSDFGLFTAARDITADVLRVFQHLSGAYDLRADGPSCDTLMVAPFTMRDRFLAELDTVAEAARSGRTAVCRLKMNALEDQRMIDALYETAAAGADIQLVVRGICRLIPGQPGLSTGIRAVSIVDRYLEHARIYRFIAGDDEHLWLASADWMERNLERRIEVAFPVRDGRLRSIVLDVLDLQLRDNVRARSLAVEAENGLVAGGDGPAIRSQFEIYRMLRDVSDAEPT